MDLRILKYFPFGGVKRLDAVAEFFNFVQQRQRLPDQSGVRLRFDSDTRI